MRQVMLGDLIAVASCILSAPQHQREGRIEDLFHRAHIADKVMKRLRRPHLAWGNGSLMTIANCNAPLAEPFLSDLEFVDAFSRVLAYQRRRLDLHRQKEK
jgi:hypothetical protein